MEETLFRKIVDEVSTVPYFSEVLFELHNEPLLDERTFQFIEYVKTRYKNKACTIVTNGQLIDRFSLSEIKKSNVDLFVISLNAHSPETYEYISGGLSYKKIEKNIAIVMSEPDLKRKLVLSFVITEPTVSEINQALQYWKEKQVRTRTIKVTNRAGVLSDFESVRLKTGTVKSSLLETAWQGAIRKMLRVAGCYKPFLETDILYNGDVILCCHDWNRTTVLGNLHESSLQEIWNSPKLNEIRRLITQKKYAQIDLCKNCSEIR